MVAPASERRSRSRGRSVRGGTSLGGGKVRSGHRVHGMKHSSDDASAKRSARSKSRDRRDGGRKQREYSTPFDDKGRCHYHKNVQLAAKKQFGGGWKVLHAVCPKCMEQKLEGGSGDERSVRSGKSTGGGGGGNKSGGGRYDANGCCVVHSHIQVAKKKVLGGGWKVMRTCPACEGEDVDADDYSVRSGRSARSASSRKSTRSTKSGKSRAKPGKATQSGRYGALPFDGDGYCCQHPHVQLAKRKTLGGFKIIHDVCPECAKEKGISTSSRRGGRSRSKSRSRRPSRHDDHDSGSSACDTSTKKKKRIRVKNLKTEDGDGNRGRYSGYVNDDHAPHGNGVFAYDDGTEWEGVWSDGCQVHGKMRKAGKQGAKSKF